MHAVDAWSFEDEVHRAADLTDPAAVHASLSGALASWRGAAFEEFGGLPWADLEASRLAELRLAALEARADAALRLGRAAQVVADLERLTADQRLREEGWRLLALALYQSGRQADALAALRRVRALLASELGVDPGAALRDLERDILAQRPGLATAGNTPGAGPTSGEALPVQLAGLPDTARTLLLHASVIGIEADVSVLADIADAEEDALLAAVDRAVGAGLVTEPEPGRIRFADPLVRDALYRSLSRFGSEKFGSTPREADLLIVSGRVSQKMAPVLRQFYDQMADPKWVIAMGVCASSGGMFNNYAIVQGVDHVIPVDVYLPGCPPRPEMLLDAILKLRDRIENTRLGAHREQEISAREQSRLGLRSQPKPV